MCDGERSRRLGLDDAGRSEAALAVVVRVVVAVERIDVDDLGPRLLRRRYYHHVVVFEEVDDVVRAFLLLRRRRRRHVDVDDVSHVASY